MKDPEILTQLLRLSPLIASDAPAMFEYRSDPEVCRYQNFEPGSLGDVEDFIGDLGIHFSAKDPRQVEIGIKLIYELDE